MPPGFYLRPTLEVAADLLGKFLVRHQPGEGPRTARITEVEAYIGEEDRACHARFGRTARNAPMYEAGGIAYVYLVYGLHHCLNVVTEAKGRPAAVLIRSAALIGAGPRSDGPGRLGRALSISRELSGHDLATPPLVVAGDGSRPPRHRTGPRIGVGYSGAWAARPWRLWVPEVS
ncbi:MAG: DNA-3-methyladenine glycosylase [Candidatus Dormibacteria bacterium]